MDSTRTRGTSAWPALDHACLASAVVAGGPFDFAVLTLGPLFLRRVRAEDRLMTALFPEEYPAYMRRTKALIPFVW